MERVVRSRKYVSLLLGSLFVASLSLAACGEGAVEEEPAEDPVEEEEMEEEDEDEDEDGGGGY